MIQITFAKKEIDELHYERFHHPHPRVQRKMEALYLKSQTSKYLLAGLAKNKTMEQINRVTIKLFKEVEPGASQLGAEYKYLGE